MKSLHGVDISSEIIDLEINDINNDTVFALSKEEEMEFREGYKMYQIKMKLREM